MPRFSCPRATPGGTIRDGPLISIGCCPVAQKGAQRRQGADQHGARAGRRTRIPDDVLPAMRRAASAMRTSPPRWWWRTHVASSRAASPT